MIYYESLRDGRRIKLSTKTDDWTEAAAFRDLYESRMGSSLAFKSADEVPRFGEFSERYLREETERLLATTRRDREGHLRASGPSRGTSRR